MRHVCGTIIVLIYVLHSLKEFFVIITHCPFSKQNILYGYSDKHPASLSTMPNENLPTLLCKLYAPFLHIMLLIMYTVVCISNNA